MYARAPSADNLASGQTFLAQYILDRLVQLGVKQLFGVPGDFTLSFNDVIEQDTRIRWIGCCNELNASYAADGYARVKQAQLNRAPDESGKIQGGVRGLAAMVTTFGVGELSCMNGIAGAYAERVPIIHIVGVPSTKLQKGHVILHHTLGDVGGRFDVFKNATSEMTCAQAYLSSAENAAAEIDRILLAALTTARPAYLTLPTDLVYAPVDASRLQKPLIPSGPLDERLPTGKTLKQETEERLAFVVDQIERLWEQAEDPIIIVDACAVRFGAGHLVEDLVKATGVRWFVTPMGRTILDEDPSTGFGGTYVAQLSDERIRGAVEKTDLAIMVGAMRSDLNTGLWSSKIETKNIIELHSNCTLVQYATYDKISFHLLLPALARVLKRKSSIPASPTLPLVPLPAGQPADNLTHDVLWPLVGQYLRERDIVVAEVGTAAFGLLTLPLPKGATFVSQVLWGCIGFSVGATLGALLAAQEAGFSRRVVLFVGDGSAQLTVQEVATIVRYGLTPTIVLLNNEGYTIERLINGPTAEYNDISLWDWSKLLPLFTPPSGSTTKPGAYFSASTRGELEAILGDEDFARSDRIQLLEVKLGRLDAPKALYRLGEVTRQVNSA
ncbi:hypothetical protein Rhopal_001386-T1 [Rhodotorula paludigena]|uniref:Pyruvate decarboxylase n=1 Tax=Rhodotorula paludigena TaxID=86838 RepID=A0AAV5GF98_9BASI|nr:hypothetical protein Rhopal_001386-T1 [Rhodotorula paludigena]